MVETATRRGLCARSTDLLRGTTYTRAHGTTLGHVFHIAIIAITSKKVLVGMFSFLHLGKISVLLFMPQCAFRFFCIARRYWVCGALPTSVRHPV
jgi:tetrahydromethanopterin S-methyltransferase subunit F